MALQFAAGLRACIVVVALTLATAQAEEQKQTSLLGATREQVLERFGQPRRGMVAGNREVMFFARERLVLRDGVVIEIEPLAVEPPPPPPPAPATTSAGPESEPAAAAAPGATDPAALRPASAPGGAAANADTANAPALDSSPAVAPEPQLEISFVRTPSAGLRPRTELTRRAPPTLPAPTGPAPRVEPVAVAAPVATTAMATRRKVGPVASSPTPAPRDVAPPRSAPRDAAVSRARTVTALVPEEDETESVENDVAAETGEAASRPPVEDRKARSPARHRLSEADFPAPAESIFTTRTYVISLFVIVGGIGYLLWQRHQRRLDLEASSVSRTPFIAPASHGAPTRFTTELLAKLEWRRFEELVASYYGKTGVVAVRTRTGPLSPVQIRISWKGEPRPFACVRCIPHPQGLIDPQPIQELNEVLTKEDIRRGYVVTTGRFNVPARDLAEEKHITLLPGDIFVEKLNALPDAARAELMQEITTGDYATPSCPRCEAPAACPEGEPAAWRCPHHPDEVIPARP